MVCSPVIYPQLLRIDTPFPVIRAGLLWGKLSQTTQSLYVIRSSVRAFEKEQWEVLEKRVLAWKTGLQSVLDVVNSAKRMAGHVPQASATASA